MSQNQRWKAKCAKGTFIMEFDPDRETWKAGGFTPVKESTLFALMGDRKDDDDFLADILKALAWRATKKMNQSPDLILKYVVADVKKGKQPAKSLGEWVITEIEEPEKTTVSKVKAAEHPGDALLEVQMGLMDGIQDWAQESAIKAAHRHRERVAEGYEEFDLDGNPK